MEEFAKYDCRLIKDEESLVWLGMALWEE